MSYANQHEYDNASEPDLSDYREEPMFAQFAERQYLEFKEDQSVKETT